MSKKPDKQITIHDKWEKDDDDDFWDQFGKPEEEDEEKEPPRRSKLAFVDLMVDSLTFPSMLDLSELIEYIKRRSEGGEDGGGKKPGWSGGGGSPGGGSSGGAATTEKKPEKEPAKETSYPGSDGSHVEEYDYFEMSDQDKIDLAESGGTEADFQNSVIAKRLGVTPEEAGIMRKSVEDYSGASYKTIRAAQSGNKNYDFFSPKHKEGAENQGKAIDKFVEKSPKFKGEIYRGVASTQGRLDAMKVGSTFSMNGSSSWSSDSSKAKKFSSAAPDAGKRRVMFISDNKSGASIKHLSHYPEEKEVLHSSKTKFKISKIEDDGGKDSIVRIHVREI